MRKNFLYQKGFFLVSKPKPKILNHQPTDHYTNRSNNNLLELDIRIPDYNPYNSNL